MMLFVTIYFTFLHSKSIRFYRTPIDGTLLLHVTSGKRAEVRRSYNHTLFWFSLKSKRLSDYFWVIVNPKMIRVSKLVHSIMRQDIPSQCLKYAYIVDNLSPKS